MREEVKDIERLSHMLEAINVLINYKEHHTLEEAKSDPVVYFGLVKHVEIIGEAVYKLTHEFRDTHRIELGRHRAYAPRLSTWLLQNSPRPTLGDYHYRYSRNKADNRAVDSAREIGIKAIIMNKPQNETAYGNIAK